MKKAELFEFLDSWIQQDKIKDGFKPINRYQLHAYLLGPGFYLKWYLPKNHFIAIAKELDYDLEREWQTRLFSNTVIKMSNLNYSHKNNLNCYVVQAMYR